MPNTMPDPYVCEQARLSRDPPERGAGLAASVALARRRAALKLEVHGAPPARLLGIVGRVRRMFDLGAEPQTSATALSVHPRLRALLRRRPGLRLPSGWDGFEIAVRAIIGQQVSVAAAHTVASCIAQRFGRQLALPGAEGLAHMFPDAQALAGDGSRPSARAYAVIQLRRDASQPAPVARRAA